MYSVYFVVIETMSRVIIFPYCKWRYFQIFFMFTLKQSHSRWQAGAKLHRWLGVNPRDESRKLFHLQCRIVTSVCISVNISVWSLTQYLILLIPVILLWIGKGMNKTVFCKWFIVSVSYCTQVSERWNTLYSVSESDYVKHFGNRKFKVSNNDKVWLCSIFNPGQNCLDKLQSTKDLRILVSLLNHSTTLIKVCTTAKPLSGNITEGLQGFIWEFWIVQYVSIADHVWKTCTNMCTESKDKKVK